MYYYVGRILGRSFRYTSKSYQKNGKKAYGLPKLVGFRELLVTYQLFYRDKKHGAVGFWNILKSSTQNPTERTLLSMTRSYVQFSEFLRAVAKIDGIQRNSTEEKIT